MLKQTLKYQEAILVFAEEVHMLGQMGRQLEETREDLSSVWRQIPDDSKI